MESIIKTISTPTFFTVNNSYPIQTDISLDVEPNEIIGVTATALHQSVECSKGSVKVGVRVLFTVLYGSDKVLVYESGVDYNFEQRDEKIEPNSLYKQNCICDDAKILVNDDGSLTVSTVIEFSATFCVTNQLSFLQDVDGAEVKTEQKKVVSMQKCLQPVTATFDGEKQLNFEIERVLCHSDSVRVLQTESGIGEIIVDGEILSEFSLLTVAGEVVNTSMLTAFRYEIECDGVSVDNLSFANACMQNANFKISFLNDENSSKVTGEYQIVFNAVVLSENTVSCVIDGFSTTHELLLSYENLIFDNAFSFSSYKHKCFGEGICELEKGERVICALSGRVDILQATKQEKLANTKIEGIVNLSLLTQLGESKKIKSAKVAFDFNLDSDLQLSDLSATVKNIVVRSLEQKCIIDCEVVFSALFKNSESSNMACHAEEGEARTVTQSAISVLFISKGDDLWTVCKKALASEKNILADNPDITFPATSDKAIVVYKRLGE